MTLSHSNHGKHNQTERRETETANYYAKLCSNPLTYLSHSGQQDTSGKPTPMPNLRTRSKMATHVDSDFGDGDHNSGDDGDDTFTEGTNSGSDGECDEQSEEGSISSEIYVDAPQLPRQTSHKNPAQKPPARAIRSVMANTSVSKTKNVVDISGPTGGFKFLQLEAYICSCCHTAPELHGMANSAKTNVFPRTRCKVLLYFGMIFLPDMQAIFCPAHNCFVPMAEWATHVRCNHKDWVSATKIDECSRMAEHVSVSCGLDLRQKPIDLRLPLEIEAPFSSYMTLPASPIHRSFRCPKCSLWQAQAKDSGRPDRYMRRHLRDECPNGRFSDWQTVPLDEPHWTYRVSTSCGTSHVFILPPDWDGIGEDEEPAELPELPSQDHTIRSVSSRTPCQDWPLKLGWTAYDKEISASDNITALRQLILRPRCGCRRRTRNLDFLEEGLHMIGHAISKYFMSSMVFVHKKHKKVIDEIVSE